MAEMPGFSPESTPAQTTGALFPAHAGVILDENDWLEVQKTFSPPTRG